MIEANEGFCGLGGTGMGLKDSCPPGQPSVNRPWPFVTSPFQDTGSKEDSNATDPLRNRLSEGVSTPNNWPLWSHQKRQKKVMNVR